MRGMGAAIEFIKEWSAIGVASVALLAILAGKGSLAALGRWRDAIGAAVFSGFPGVRAERIGKENRSELHAIKDALQAILVELKTNGGSSLKDAINRVEDNQVRTNSLTHLILARDDGLAAFMTDHNGLYDWISPAHHKLTGRPIDEVGGWGWLSSVHPDDADHVREGWASAVTGGWPFSMRFRIARRDGETILVHSTANPLMAGPRVIGWSGLISVEDAQ